MIYAVIELINIIRAKLFCLI